MNRQNYVRKQMAYVFLTGVVVCPNLKDRYISATIKSKEKKIVLKNTLSQYLMIIIPVCLYMCVLHTYSKNSSLIIMN